VKAPERKAKPRKPRTGAAHVRRASERDARMAWILDAALDLAVEEGFEAVTTTRLAERLGYTVGAFYRYWPSVDELLAALHRRTAELFYDAMWAAWIPAREALAETARRRSPRVRALAQLCLLLLLYRRLADAHPKRFELVGQLVTRSWRWIDEPMQRRLDALVLPRVAEVIGAVAAAEEARALAPGETPLRTMTLWVGVHAALATGTLAAKHPDLLSRDALVLSMIRSLLLGWGAAPADLDTALELAEATLKGVA
jgi:AcrR family transcriptional regulator